MRKAPLFLMILSLVAFAPDAAAKNRDKSWEFGVFVSHLDGDGSVGIENAVGAGFNVGFNFSAKVEAELTVSQHQIDFGGQDEATAAGLAGAGTGPVLVGLPERDDELMRAIVAVTGNFLTDRETRTVPYLTAGLGVLRETRDSFSLQARVVNPADPNGTDPNIPDLLIVDAPVNESFDSSAVLMIGVGARSFFTDNFAVKYDVRYYHHNSFDDGQDEYQVTVGATWVLGGQK